MQEQHHQIGAAAEAVGLSLRTIRYYEEIGLVTPTGRTDGGFRLYTDADIDRLRLVKALKPVGMSLETMGELLIRADALEAAIDSGTEVESAASAFEEVLAVARRRCDEWEDRLGQARQVLAAFDRLTPGRSR
ncbi:MAG TPA: MerR family transcriptional regulator [Acidimicrobiia bacterium]|nr:MerR family transcriptional regulator [Acidimicrobiia bacterium]